MPQEAAPAPDTCHARDRALSALALASEGRDPEAVAEAAAVVALAPHCAWAHLTRAAVLREAGHNAEALRAAETAVRLAPDDARAHRELAAALAALGRSPEARVAARRASQLAPDDAAVLRRLGDLAIDVDPAEAERHYRRGLRCAPGSAAAHAGLARALRRLGRREEAELEYERAAAVDPSVSELRRRAGALLGTIVQAAIGTFLAILVLGLAPEAVAVHRPELRGPIGAVASMLAVAAPLALLGWTAARARRLAREAPVAPDVREDLRDIAGVLSVRPTS